MIALKKLKSVAIKPLKKKIGKYIKQRKSSELATL